MLQGRLYVPLQNAHQLLETDSQLEAAILFSQPQFVLELYETLNCGRGGGRMAVHTVSSVNQKLKGGATVK